MRGAYVGAGSHGGHVSGQGDDEPGRRRTRARRAHEHGHGGAAVEHGVDDLAHRGVEAARGVDLDHDEGCVGEVGALDCGDDVGGRDGVDDAVERDHRDVGRGALGEHDQDGHRQQYPGDTQHG